MRSKPRILLVTPDYPPSRGGIQLLMEQLVRNMQRVDVTVLTLSHPEASPTAGVVRVRKAPCGHHRAGIAVLNARAIREALGRRPDVVLSGHVVLAPAMAVIARSLRIPIVELLYSSELSGSPRLAKTAIGVATVNIAISRHTADQARRLDKWARIVVIHPGVETSPPVHASRAATPTIIAVGRLGERYKGHDVLLRALPLVVARVPDVQLILVGDGPARAAYEALAASLSLGPHVQFTGAVSDDARDQWLDRGHVFALPGRTDLRGGGEGFGIVFLEAGAHGLPVVAGDAAGATDAVAHGKSGLLVPPNDHVAVARALIELLLDAGRRAQLGRAGATQAASRPWTAAAVEVEDLLLSLCPA